jgi:hypothetical protein
MFKPMIPTARQVNTAIALLTAILFAGCGIPEDDEENLGRSLTPEGEVRGDAELAWSQDGSEIFYLASPLTGPMSLKAAKVDGSGVRIIDDSKPNYWTLVMPPDGSSLYYTALENGRSDRSLYEAFRPREIAGMALDTKADVVAAAPDDRHLAFWSGGKLQYFDTADGSSVLLAEDTPIFHFTAGNHEVLTFSPAGDELFFLHGTSSGDLGGSVIGTASRAVQPKTLSGRLWPAVNWNQDGIHILWSLASPVAYQVENVTTGQVDSLWQPPNGALSTRNVWSPDGRQVAIWDSRCVASSGFLSCDKSQDDLYVIDVVTHEATRVARTSGGLGTMAFAPDGRRIAYFARGRLYVSDL